MSDYLRDILGIGKEDLSKSEIPSPIVAADIPSADGEGANEGFWRTQLRDRKGRWSEMGRSIIFEMDMPDIGRVTGHGTLLKVSRPGVGLVRIDEHPVLEPGEYEIPGDSFEAANAIIPAADFERITGKDLGLKESDTPDLKDEITGDEALSKIYGSMAAHAKESGRFAVGRNADDVKAAAKETYKTVYEKLKVEYPELMKDFNSYDQYWDKASNGLAAGFMTRWEDSVDDIDPLTKASNKIYAREILGLKEDGLIEYYRNSVNHMGSKEWAAAGYASLDRRMAWDYNSYISKYADSGLTENDGRYIVKVKPDEVSGLIGYSQIADEYGVVVGLDVVSQDGRSERVGDLEMQKVSPWSDDIEKFNRNGGASPFRRVSPASQFEVFATENPVPGNGYADFYTAFGLDKDSRPIPTKWDELYGEGSFEELNGQYPGYRSIQSLFVDAGDGKVGLDMMALDELSGRYSANPEANDEYDKTLKMLSVIQELSGKTYMVHRGRSKKDDRIPDAPDPQSVDVPEPISIEPSNTEKIDLSGGSLDAAEVELDGIDSDILEWFGDTGYESISNHLRKGEEFSDNEQIALDAINDIISKSTVKSPSVVFRGRAVNLDRHPEILDLEVGDTIIDPGIGSTTLNPDRAEFYAKLRKDDKHLNTIYKINIPAGANAYNIPDSIASYKQDKEVLLPSGSQLQITNIEDQDGIRVFEADLVFNPPQAVEKVLDYQMAHRAPNRDAIQIEEGVSRSLDKIDEIFPPDVLDTSKQKRLYRSGYDEADNEAFEVINKINGNPDAEITIYRGVPDGVSDINDGDWVTLSPKYAQRHVDSNVPGGKVISKKVKASEIFTNADSIQEWGYSPEAAKKVEDQQPEALKGWSATEGLAEVDTTIDKLLTNKTAGTIENKLKEFYMGKQFGNLEVSSLKYESFEIDPDNRTRFGKYPFRGEFMDPTTGEYAGNFYRIIKVDSDGNYNVDHDGLYIEDEFRGKGAGTAFSKFSEDLYKKLGIKNINIVAGMDDGSYTWAKAGYEWAKKPYRVIETIDYTLLELENTDYSKELKEKIKNKLEEVAELLSLDFRDPQYPTPIELANINIPGVNFGRILFPKDTEWEGIKRL